MPGFCTSGRRDAPPAVGIWPSVRYPSPENYCLHTEGDQEEDMANPILRARQALRNAELQAENADANGMEDDIETGPGTVSTTPPASNYNVSCHL